MDETTQARIRKEAVVECLRNNITAGTAGLSKTTNARLQCSRCTNLLGGPFLSQESSNWSRKVQCSVRKTAPGPHTRTRQHPFLNWILPSHGAELFSRGRHSCLNISWNLKVLYCVHKSHRSLSCLSQIRPLHSTSSYLSKKKTKLRVMSPWANYVDQATPLVGD